MMVIHDRRLSQQPHRALAQCHLVPSTKITVDTPILIPLIPVHPKDQLRITQQHHRNRVLSSFLGCDSWPD